MKDIKDQIKSMRHAKLRSFGHKGEIPDAAAKHRAACGGKIHRADGGRIHRDIGGGLLHDDDMGPMDGGQSRPRLDRKARGNTTININVAKPDPAGAAAAMPPPPPPMAGAGGPLPGGMPPPMPMPPPGMMPPPMMGGMPPPPGMMPQRPPGMNTGGRVAKAFGGPLAGQPGGPRKLPRAVAARIAPKPAGIPTGSTPPQFADGGSVPHKGWGGPLGYAGGAPHWGAPRFAPNAVHYPPWNGPAGTTDPYAHFPPGSRAAYGPGVPIGSIPPGFGSAPAPGPAGVTHVGPGPTPPIPNQPYPPPGGASPAPMPSPDTPHPVMPQVPAAASAPAPAPSPAGFPVGSRAAYGPGVPIGSIPPGFGSAPMPGGGKFARGGRTGPNRGGGRLEGIPYGKNQNNDDRIKVQHDGYDNLNKRPYGSDYGAAHSEVPEGVERARGGHVDLDAGAASGEGRLEKVGRGYKKGGR